MKNAATFNSNCMTQGTIDWTQAEHHRENTIANQQHHDSNFYHFTGQDAFVLLLLQQGHELTTMDALIQYRIGDLRRRIKTLKDAGVPIISDFTIDEQGNKTRFKTHSLKQNSK